MYIEREDVKNILRYDDFSQLFNVILSFPEFSLEFLTNGITFLMSNSKRAMEWKNNGIEGLIFM